MRLFLAIECPGEVKDRLVGVQGDVIGFGSMKAVEYGNLHVTLKFLGEVDDGKVGELRRALASIEQPKFNVTVKGLGVFPKPDYVRVLWAGVEEGFNEVVELHSKVESALKPLGFGGDRDYHPHVTLARVKGSVDVGRLRGFMDSHLETIFGSYGVDEFTLIESRLTSKGPVYTKVQGFGLK
jgi:2'-5' RNA ligase